MPGMRLFSHVLAILAATGVSAVPMLQVLDSLDAKPHPERWLQSSERGISTGDELVEREVGGVKTIDIGRKWENVVLFETTYLTLPEGTDTGLLTATNLKLTCVECWTKGSLGFEFTMGGFDEDEEKKDESGLSLLDQLKDRVEDLADDLADLDELFYPKLRINLANVEVYTHLEMKVSGTLIYNFRLWTWDLSPFIDTEGILKIGPTVSLDLMFMLGSSVDLETGFHVTFPPDAFLEIDIREGDISDQFTKGMVVKQMPVKITIGDVAVIATLRVTAGVDVNPGASVNPPRVGGKSKAKSSGSSPGNPAAGSAMGSVGSFSDLVGRDEKDSEQEQEDSAEFENSDEDYIDGSNSTGIANIEDRAFNPFAKLPFFRTVYGSSNSGLAKFGFGVGVSVFANLLEWNAIFKADIQGVTDCRVQVSHGINFNVGSAWYAALLLRNRMIGPMPRTSWKLLESKPMSTCVIENPEKTPLFDFVPTIVNGDVTDSATPTAQVTGPAAQPPAPTAGPTSKPGLVAVPYTLTTCSSAIVNCPDELIGTTVITNYMDPAAASEAPLNNNVRPDTTVAPEEAPPPAEPTPTEEPGFLNKAKNKIGGLFGRGLPSDDWPIVEWMDQVEPELMSLTVSIPTPASTEVPAATEVPAPADVPAPTETVAA